MQSLFLAIQFLTLINLGIKSFDNKKFSSCLIYFPFVGLILGLILVGLENLFNLFDFNSFTTAVLLVTSLAILTRSIHLDGLADTFDALLSNKPSQQMLTIMHDPHLGTMGVVSIFLVLLLKTSLINSLSFWNIANALIVMCVGSRWLQVFSIFFFKYARDDGKVKILMENISLRIFILSSIITFFCVILFGGWKSLAAVLAATVFSFIFCKNISRKLGGITGDVIGALTEISEVIILLVFVTIGG